VLATGGGVVEDEDNRRRLRQASKVVWIDLRLETVRSRLAASGGGGRPLVRRLGWDGLVELYRHRRALYAQVAHFRFDGDHLAPAVLARRIVVSLQPELTP
jgi:shikimate kinase